MSSQTSVKEEIYTTVGKVLKSFAQPNVVLRNSRVEDIEDSMNDIRNQVDVALPASSPCVHTKGLFHGKAKEQQLGVMNVELVRGFPLPCALLQICIVPANQQICAQNYMLVKNTFIYTGKIILTRLTQR